jgi:hypothetical protein
VGMSRNKERVEKYRSTWIWSRLQAYIVQMLHTPIGPSFFMCTNAHPFWVYFSGKNGHLFTYTEFTANQVAARRSAEGGYVARAKQNLCQASTAV